MVVFCFFVDLLVCFLWCGTGWTNQLSNALKYRHECSNVILQPRRGIARCMLGSIHLQFVKNDQSNKTNINNTVCMATQKKIYCVYPPHSTSTSVNKEVIDDFGGNCNGGSVDTIPDRYKNGVSGII